MNNNFYFNNKNILSCFTKEEIKKTWNELLLKEKKEIDDFYKWHLKYTPWFSDEINKEISILEYNKLIKNI